MKGRGIYEINVLSQHVFKRKVKTMKKIIGYVNTEYSAMFSVEPIKIEVNCENICYCFTQKFSDVASKNLKYTTETVRRILQQFTKIDDLNNQNFFVKQIDGYWEYRDGIGILTVVMVNRDHITKFIEL